VLTWEIEKRGLPLDAAISRSYEPFDM